MTRKRAEELARELRAMRDGGYENREATAMVHLFGVMHGDEIGKMGAPPSHLVKLAGMSTGALSELRKGIKLSQYVRPIESYA